MIMRGTHKRPITILICDDDEDDRLRTQQTLEDARVSNSLRMVGGGEQLLDYLHQRGAFAGETGAAPRPGLILLALDSSMADSADALRQIRQAPTLFDIPIVGLTTAYVDDGIDRTHWSGVSAFIPKPMTFYGLMEGMKPLGRYWLEVVELPPSPT
jgi:CheY-like chemotaxis protein